MPLYRTVHWFLLACMSCGLASSPAPAWGQCPRPQPDTPRCDTRGQMQVSWAVDRCQPDTLVAHTGPLSQGFRPASGYPVQAVAIRLDSLSAGTSIRSLRAYVLGKSGTSEESWTRKALLVWSLNYDSTGYPGRLASPLRYWPLGDEPLLRTGGWYEDSLDWEIGSPTPTSYWLVGMWPDGAAEAVLLGGDGLSAPYTEVAGVGEDGITYWTRIYDPGLLIEIGIGAETTDTGQQLKVICDRGGNPLARAVTPVRDVGYCDGAFVDSSVAWPEHVRYGFITDCGTAESDTVWTAFAGIVPPWDIGVAPESLFISMPQSGHESVHLSLENPTSVPLLAAVVETGFPAAGAGSPAITPVVESLGLPAGGTVDLRLDFSTSGCDLGTYRGAAILAVGNAGDSTGFALGIPVQVVVDQQTSVSEVDSAAIGSVPAEWRLRAGPNPFADGVRLRIEWNSGLIPRADASSIGVAGRHAAPIEVAVYNVLGQLIWHQHRVVDPSATAGAGEMEVQITGTNSWPNGVYICRTRLAGQSQSITLLHIK